MKSPQDFVEWLLTEGLIRTQQYCSVHKSHPSNQPLKLKVSLITNYDFDLFYLSFQKL